MGSKDRLACVNKKFVSANLPARDFTCTCVQHVLFRLMEFNKVVRVFHLSLFLYGH